MPWPGLLAAIAVGFGSGYLSGQLGIGGGMLTTPAIRLMLGYPAYVAVGTPLLVIIPTTLVAAVQYVRSELVDWPLAARVAATGLVGTVVGSYVTKLMPGGIILVMTAVVMAAVAVRMVCERRRGEAAETARPRWLLAYAVGLAAGLFSGFLGLGGGVILVPGFVGPLHRSIKTAFGTSLVVICVLAVPGTMVHWLLGHVDLRLAALLVVGVVPGAWLGARIAIRAPENVLRVAFAAFLGVVAITLGTSEILGMLRT